MSCSLGLFVFRNELFPIIAKSIVSIRYPENSSAIEKGLLTGAGQEPSRND